MFNWAKKIAGKAFKAVKDTVGSVGKVAVGLVLGKGDKPAVSVDVAGQSGDIDYQVGYNKNVAGVASGTNIAYGLKNMLPFIEVAGLIYWLVK